MIAKIRSWFYTGKILQPRSLPAFVLSVGNISLGGTGKSPFVMLLAERAVAQGLRVAVLSRGYKRKSEKLVIVGSHEELPPVEELGDEPWMIKRRIPGISLLVHPQRAREAEKNWARLGAPELVILDDGFQHWKLARDRDVVMIDASEPIFGPTLPFGRLREEASALGRADLVVVTRARALPPDEKNTLANHLRANLERRASAPWKKTGTTQPGVAWVDYSLTGFFDAKTSARVEVDSAREYVLVTGIAKPAGFARLLQERGLVIREQLEFPDHHILTAQDRQKILDSVRSLARGTLVLTEKDWARWRTDLTGVSALVAEVKFDFLDGVEQVDRLLSEVVEGAKRCSISG